MKNVLLSICISSYNRGNKCLQLVNRILTIQDKRYNIFICDDCSDNDTFVKLQSLVSCKVTLVQNEKNLGPCSNWYETINCGNGAYILHILDRDDIDIDYLTSMLNILEQNSVGAGYFGKSAISPEEGIKKQKNFAVCKKGKEAFLMMGEPVHPTGFFVERRIWKQKNFKKFFYENKKYGIYPHAYVLGIIALERDILFSPIPFYCHMYRLNNRKSRFYVNKKSKDYWWLPNNVMKTSNKLILYLSQFAEASYAEDFICKKFEHGLYRSTISYKKTIENEMEMERYGFRIKYISKEELILNSLKYRTVFIHILNKLEINKSSIRKRINKIWYENLKLIIRGY